MITKMYKIEKNIINFEMTPLYYYKFWKRNKKIPTDELQ